MFAPNFVGCAVGASGKSIVATTSVCAPLDAGSITADGDDVNDITVVVRAGAVAGQTYPSEHAAFDMSNSCPSMQLYVIDERDP
jgi:pectin methylesterase-like acyl-CoA thioesterase